MAEIRDEDWFRVNDTVKRLEHAILGNGKPPLEERLRAYIDMRDTHKERNAKQDLVDMRHEIDEKHKENTKTLDKIELNQGKISDKQDKIATYVYIGLGIVGTLEALGLFKR